MQDYIFVTITSLCIAITFVFNKLYQVKIVNKSIHLILFPLFTSTIAAFLFLCINGFKLQTNAFVLTCASVYAVCLSSYTIIGMIAMKYGKLSIYTIFLMIGGMLLPYFYGVIFLEEEITVCRVVGMILLIASLILNVGRKEDGKKKNKKIFWVLCILVFFLNGGTSIASKVHQISPNATSTINFMIWVRIIKMCVLSLVAIVCLLMGLNKKNKEVGAVGIDKTKPKFNIKLFIIIIACVVLLESVNIFCSLNASKTMPAMVQFPFTTGLSTIATAVMARIFFKEKITKQSLISLILMLVSTILFIF